MTDHAAETYAIAWALFHARCLADEASPGEIALMWEVDPGVREFWLGQAQIALDAQALHQREKAG